MDCAIDVVAKRRGRFFDVQLPLGVRLAFARLGIEGCDIESEAKDMARDFVRNGRPGLDEVPMRLRVTVEIEVGIGACNCGQPGESFRTVSGWRVMCADCQRIVQAAEEAEEAGCEPA